MVSFNYVTMMVMIIVILALLGLIIGSFVNALIWRLHEQDTEKAKKKPDRHYLKELSVTRGRSMCPHCKHTLAVKDLIPLLSWLALGGKCRYCRRPIGAQYPLVEMGTSLLFVLSYLYWPVTFDGKGEFNFVVWLIVLTGLVALAVYDLKWYLLPNKVVYTLAGVAILGILSNLAFYHGGHHLLWLSFWGIVFGGGLFWVLFQVSRGKWIGGGDVKLGTVLGLLVGGPLPALLLLFLASLSGSLVSIPLLISKKVRRDSQIPFGPFLILAAVVVELFGSSIINWMQNRNLLPRY